MFCVIYRFRVKEGKNAQFEKAWADFTDAIHRAKGSLGSRLHNTNDPRDYIAYAQWPSKFVFDSSANMDGYSESDLKARELMREALEGDIDQTHLSVLDDRLVQKN